MGLPYVTFRLQTAANGPRKGTYPMNILLIVIIVVAIVLAITGGLVSSLNFLLWVGIILLVLAIIGFLIRLLTGSRRV